MDPDPNYPRGNTFHEELLQPHRYLWRTMVHCDPIPDEKLAPRDRQAKREAEEQKKKPDQPQVVKKEEVNLDYRSNLVRYMRGLKGFFPTGHDVTHPDQFYEPECLIGTDREGWYDRCLPYSSPIKGSTSASVVETRAPGDPRDGLPTKSVSDVSAASSISSQPAGAGLPRKEKVKASKSGSKKKKKKTSKSGNKKGKGSSGKKSGNKKSSKKRKKKDKSTSSKGKESNGDKTPKSAEVSEKASPNRKGNPPTPASSKNTTPKSSEPKSESMSEITKSVSTGRQEDAKKTPQTRTGANVKGPTATKETPPPADSKPTTPRPTGSSAKATAPAKIKEPTLTSASKKEPPKSTAVEATAIQPEPRFSSPTPKQTGKADKVVSKKKERSQSVQYTTPKPSPKLGGNPKKSKSKPKNTKAVATADPVSEPTQNDANKVDLPASPKKEHPKVELGKVQPSPTKTESTNQDVKTVPTEASETPSGAPSTATSSGGTSIPTDEMEPFPVTKGTGKRITGAKEAESAESTTVKVTVSGSTTNEDEDESNVKNVLDEARKYFQGEKDDDSPNKRNTGGGCKSRTRSNVSSNQTLTDSKFTSHESACYSALQPHGEKLFLVKRFDDVSLKYLQKRTKNGFALDDCLNHDKTLTEDIELPLLTGLKACDSECYLKFRKTFKPTIEEFHKSWMIQDFQDHQSDFRLEQVPKIEFSTNHIELFTAKLYRNIKGLPFALSSDMEDRIQTEKMIKHLLCRIDPKYFDGVYYSMRKLTIPTKLWLVGKGMWINPIYFADYSDSNDDWKEGRGVWMSDDRSIVVYINGFEHITVYACSSDNQPYTVIKSLTSFMVLLKKILSNIGQKFSKHPSYGHLMARPEFIGNGLTLSMEFIKSTQMPAMRVVDIANKNSMIATPLDRSRQLWRISTKETLSMTGAELFVSMIQTVNQLVSSRTVKCVIEGKSKLPKPITTTNTMRRSKMKREESASLQKCN